METTELLRQLTATVASIDAKQNVMAKDVSVIKTTVVGIPETQVKGLIHHVDNNTKNIKKLETKVQNIEQGNFRRNVVISALSTITGLFIGTATNQHIWDRISSLFHISGK